MTSTLQARFSDLLERHVHALAIRGQRATGCCPLHDDRHPSFSADLERCVWFCHACNHGGGVHAFAEAVGEAWSPSQRQSHTVRSRRARFRAEQQARAILERRAEERDRQLCAEHRELYGEMLAAKDLLGLFHRRPDLGEEFSDVLVETEREFSDVLFKLSVLEARLNGEME